MSHCAQFTFLEDVKQPTRKLDDSEHSLFSPKQTHSSQLSRREVVAAPLTIWNGAPLRIWTAAFWSLPLGTKKVELQWTT